MSNGNGAGTEVQTMIAGPPAFDGKVVEETAMKFSGLGSPMPCDDKVLMIDNVVRVTVEGVVTGVDHVVDKNGKLRRVQLIKPLEVEFTPFDPNDPDDDGVMRGNA